MICRLIQISFLLIIAIFSNNFAQDTDAIDIKAKVKAQMLEAQSNQNNSSTFSKSVGKNKTLKSGINENYSFPEISSAVFNLLILILSSIIVLSLVFLRRVKIQQKLISQQFKENIRLIRGEELRHPIDYSLTPIRKGLLGKIELCLNEKNISILAKKLKIAKGEILLVNGIKNYGSESNIARNQA